MAGTQVTQVPEPALSKTRIISNMKFLAVLLSAGALCYAQGVASPDNVESANKGTVMSTMSTINRMEPY